MAINLYVIGNTIKSIIYKILALESKITLSQYTLLSYLSVLILAFIALRVKNIEPFTTLPTEKRRVMLGRAFFGMSVGVLINASLELVPFSLLVILFQTNPFWTSILSFLINGEQIYLIEALGMVVCFFAVIAICVTSQ